MDCRYLKAVAHVSWTTWYKQQIDQTKGFILYPTAVKRWTDVIP